MPLLFTLNLVVAIGGLFLLALTIALFVDYFFFESKLYKRFIENFVWFIIPTLTIGSVALSLVYSDYFGFIPCSLCWLQRIALYPQALFSVMAFKSSESVYFPFYSLGLSVFGFVVAVYHYIYQMLPTDTIAGSALPCLADGSADCGLKVINLFGFVTFPFLSAVTFAFLIILYLNMRRS